MPSQEVIKKYEEVRSSLEKAIEKSNDIEISGEEEKNMLQKLQKNIKLMESL